MGKIEKTVEFAAAPEKVWAVVSDLNMPHIDGLELKHEADRICGRPIPFVLVTASTDSQTISDALKVGSAGFVAKPVQPEKMLTAVAKVLKAAGVEPPGR